MIANFYDSRGHAVTLAEWMKRKGPEASAYLAARCGCERSYFYRLRDGKARPGAALMIAIYRATHGAVTPNDFYVLPRLPKRPPAGMPGDVVRPAALVAEARP